MNLIRRSLKIRSFYHYHLLRSFFLITICVLICEFLIPLIYIIRCDWPTKCNNFTLKTIVLSDTHLFGLKRGHFLDKFKREWNMYISFQLAVYIFEPNSVFFLGDIFDEGLIANDQEFAKYSSRFFQLFSINDNVDLTVSVGNHDVGFHDRMVYFDPYLRGRFEKTFNSSLIEYKRIHGINVINVNSMALNGDNCELCNLAEYKIKKLSLKLFEQCKTESKILCEEERPILMTHFPLFRKSDLDCEESDSNYDLNEKSNIVPKKSCLSKKSTNFLLKTLQPRVALNGHTHYGCIKLHTIQVKLKNDNHLLVVKEYTLSSFNYRNRPNPAFIFLLVNANETRISRCSLPNENHLTFIYLLVISYIIIRFFKFII